MLSGKHVPRTPSWETASQQTHSGLAMARASRICARPLSTTSPESLGAFFKTRTVTAVTELLVTSATRPDEACSLLASCSGPRRGDCPPLHLLLPSTSPRAPGRERKPRDSLSCPIHKIETMLLPRPPRGSLASVLPDRVGGVLGVLQCSGRQRAPELSLRVTTAGRKCWWS